MIANLEAILGNSLSITLLDVAYVSLCNLFIAILLLRINCRDIHFLRCAGFVLIMTAVVSVPNYFVLWTFRPLFFPSGIPLNIQIWARCLLSYRNPLWLGMYFVAAKGVLQVPKRNVANAALLVFCLSELFALLSDGAEYLYRPIRNLVSPYTGFSIAQIILIVGLTFIYILVSKHIGRNIHRLKLMFEVGNEGKKHVGLANFLLGCALWVVLASSYLLNFSIPILGIETSTFLGLLYATPVLGLALCVLLYLLYERKMDHVTIHQAAVYNNSLFGTIDDFRAIRHDMNNMLQVYAGFVATEDYEGLAAFHEKLFGSAKALNDKLNFHLQLKNESALFGLFLSMEELAQSLHVVFEIEEVRLFSWIDMPDFDLCRLLSNLIKNAIESAALASKPSAHINIRCVSEDKAVITISNTTKEKVDTARIFQRGYSTKEGHTGIGLNEANKILSKYYGSTITASYSEPNLAMYISLPIKDMKETIGSSKRLPYTVVS